MTEASTCRRQRSWMIAALMWRRRSHSWRQEAEGFNGARCAERQGKGQGKGKSEGQGLLQPKPTPKSKASREGKAKATRKSKATPSPETKDPKEHDAGRSRTRRGKKGQQNLLLGEEDFDYMVHFGTSFDYEEDWHTIRDEVKEWLPQLDSCTLSIYWSRPGCGVCLKKPCKKGKKQNVAYFGFSKTIPELILSIGAAICLDTRI